MIVSLVLAPTAWIVSAPPNLAAAMRESQTGGVVAWEVALRDGWESAPAGAAWGDGAVYGAWRAVYNGYGVTRVRRVGGDSVLSMQPMVSTSIDETHASLVTTTAAFGSLDVRVSLRTTRQLRAHSPNPWEVGWLVWAFEDNTHFYYLALKPNGWELGKEDPDYPGAQRFLATGANPFPVGDWHRVRIQQVDNVITVWANGQRLTEYRDLERPYRDGQVGLYSEDAEVRFRNMVIRTP